ncbi:MAG: transcription termination factor NusA [Spirochaetia bacterium]|jgi:N utilization substance protein A|nr:transcription termination factor NusA [Spirochaetia bacterium]
MGTDLSNAINSMIEEKGISKDLVLATIENFLKAAYKRKYGTDENAVVKFSDDLNTVELFARKEIVDDDNYYEEMFEIPIEEAKKLDADCEVGDVLLIPIDIDREFDRISVQSAKQKAHQDFRDIQKDAIYSEFKTKEGQLIIGYFNRQVRGDIFVDIGSTEGILPRRFQSPRESYQQDEKIKCYVEKVEKGDRGVRVILSRTSPELVRQLFELEVPEIANHQIEIKAIAREAGIRCKVAVASNNIDIDPVGACVGLKGNRIQTVINELEGEKIDILHFDPNPVNFIKNALSPAQVQDVIILDRLTYSAVAIVDESQLSLAIGRGGTNVKLAKKLCDWKIDVKTPEQFNDLELTDVARQKAESLFAPAFDDEQLVAGDEQMEQQPQEEKQEVGETDDLVPAGRVEEGQESGIDEDELELASLPIDKNLVMKLQFHDIYTVEEYVNLTPNDFAQFGDFTQEDLDSIQSVIEQYVDIVDEEEETEQVEYKCPNCGYTITPDMTECPNCGTGLAFETIEDTKEEDEAVDHDTETEDEE